ncbi:MAG TPA: argininosuccinate lyase [Candidatus Heimdallarchaeota archaeon]|nr:argininosuccinate lyase [Candidatus Heimdallarchaeota archaeon]
MTLWGGRFQEAPDGVMRQFGDSIGFDQRLAAVDIRGSIAYAKALAQAELITAEECGRLVSGLEQVAAEFASGTFEIKPDDEDIHTAVERRLAELVGPVAGKLHTGRSRNDQVATDLRLYLLDEIGSLRQALISLQETIVGKAEGHLGVIMPGYTHLQPAQPILFSHWLMAFFWKFQRDCERLDGAAEHTRVCPLGAGALAGNPFNIDRQALAAELGFGAISQNSLDAVEDRDYVAEFLAWATLVQIHLSSLAETLIIWASREFGFVELADVYSTGSSIMPQKKNPDSLELIRGKSGRVLGHLMGLLCTLKGLPSGYNKDLQEDKEALFDVIDTLKLELPIAAGVIRTLKVNAAHMAAARDDMLLATDLADYLVQKGVPFRESHQLVGQAVRRAEKLGVSLSKLSVADFKAIHPAFGEDVHVVFAFRRSVQSRDTVGGTAPDAVKEQIEQAKALIAQNNNPH